MGLKLPLRRSKKVSPATPPEVGGNASTIWFARCDFDDGGRDEVTEWFTQISADEAAELMTAQQPDLAFLESRASIMIDERGAQRATRAPSRTGPGPL